MTGMEHGEDPCGIRVPDGAETGGLPGRRLTGSWDGEGRYSDRWSTIPMESITGEDGCPAFRAAVELDASQAGWTFRWGVILDGPGGRDKWGIHHRGQRSQLHGSNARLHSRAPPRDGDAVQQERLLPDPQPPPRGPEAPARRVAEGWHPLLGLGSQRTEGRGGHGDHVGHRRPQADAGRRSRCQWTTDRRGLHRR